MTAKALLNELTRLGVTIHHDGDKLLFIDPQRAITPAVEGALRTNRLGLLAALAERQSPSAETKRPAVEVVSLSDGRGARLVVTEDGRIAGANLKPIEMADLAEQLLDAGGRNAMAKRSGAV